MADFKELLQQKGMELLKDPRVQKLMQDERVTKGMMQALQLRGKVQDQVEKGIEASVGLAKLPPDELAAESLTDDALTTGVGFALLAGFVDDLQVRPVDDGPGTEVRMVWPVTRR